MTTTISMMTSMMTKRVIMLAAAAAMVLPVAAAHAEKKPTILLVHRNVQKQTDEKNWAQLSLDLSNDGYRVVSFAMPLGDASSLTRRDLVRLIKHEDSSDNSDKVVVVSTAAASDVAESLVQTAPELVKALVYISAEPTVATLGPRTVSEPSDLVGKVPSYQVKITANKQTSNLYERGATTFLVREQGSSTLARLSDLQNAIETIATSKALPQRASVETATKTVAGAL
jgi:pimeloyl-ACP methyl ester carboxylesterase